MTCRGPGDRVLRRAWHGAILAVADGREVSGRWRVWLSDARRWERETAKPTRKRKPVRRHPRVAYDFRPPERFPGLRGRPLREAIARAVREAQ